MKYKSKIDIWIPFVLLGIPLGLLLWVLGDVSSTLELLIVIAIFGSIIVSSGWILVATNYGFTDGFLCIRSGPFKWKIPLSDVNKIEPSRSLISSPALSLDRLEIHFGNHNCILLSPKEKSEFIAEFESRRKFCRASSAFRK